MFFVLKNNVLLISLRVLQKKGLAKKYAFLAWSQYFGFCTRTEYDRKKLRKLDTPKAFSICKKNSVLSDALRLRKRTIQEIIFSTYDRNISRKKASGNIESKTVFAQFIEIDLLYNFQSFLKSCSREVLQLSGVSLSPEEEGRFGMLGFYQLLRNISRFAFFLDWRG